MNTKRLLIVVMSLFTVLFLVSCDDEILIEKQSHEMTVKKPAETTNDRLDVVEIPKVVIPEIPETPDDDKWWEHVIIDRDQPYQDYPNFDDSEKLIYNLDALNFSTAWGEYTVSKEDDKNVYTSAKNSSILFLNNDVDMFPYGTYSVNIKPVSGSDSGIIFGLSQISQNFFEGTGVSYYFYFISRDNSIYLGKSENGNWTALSVISKAINYNETYEMKIIYQNDKIFGFINNELVTIVRDKNPLQGKGFGLRAGIANVVYSNILLSSEYIYE